MEVHDARALVKTLPEMEFRKLADFNQGHLGVFWCTAGLSPWERHPDDEELLHVLEGEVDIVVLTDAGEVTTTVGPGGFFVVPKGLWHRHHVKQRLEELYLSPGATEHSNADDPREQSR